MLATAFVFAKWKNITVPTSKNEFVKQINLLVQSEIRAIEPVDKKNTRLVRSETEGFVGNGQKEVTVVLTKNK